jgi:phosphoribosylglycinamide formyltransferase-1
MGNNKIAILLSGRGSNFVAIYDAIRRGKLDAEICCVISNLADATGLRLAQEWGLPALCIPSKGMDRAEYDRRLVEALKPHAPALVCLAGFMRILSPVFIAAFPSRVLNIHPALLPSFPGLHAQRQALDHGVKISGCTVHFADEGMDTGPIVMQRAVPVLEGDDENALSARILEQEHDVYWRAIAHTLAKISAKNAEN